MKMMKRLKHLSNKEMLRELGLLGLEKGRLRGVSSMSINTWREGTKRTEPGSFQWCPMQGQKTMGSSQNREDTLFTVIFTEHWHSLPRGAGECPSLEILKSCLSMVVNNLLWVSLLE